MIDVVNEETCWFTFIKVDATNIGMPLHQPTTPKGVIWQMKLPPSALSMQMISIKTN
jgi:hypothetical protein